MVETIRSLGHPRLPLYVLYVTIVGNPAGMRVGRERQRQFVSGYARAAVETAVDVPDHGHSMWMTFFFLATTSSSSAS